MAVPKKKTSKARTRSRRAHDAIKGSNIVYDSVTGEAKRPHHISLKDGFYNKRQVFDKPAKQEAPEEVAE
jgi:large subunit ribosomal protein L32